MSTTDPSSNYIGRFAPSPSGPLHFGSLVCALASYLDAKANSGTWLVRMEDIDPPRELPGSAISILNTLESHSLHWDKELLYQSSRSDAYKSALSELHSRKLTYRCNCPRKRLAAIDYIYDGLCRKKIVDENQEAAIRINVLEALNQIGEQSETLAFLDLIQGIQEENIVHSGDFVIHRKDGLFAYQLAVAVDDVAQGITHIVRGADLLESTPKQTLLIKLLGGRIPIYAHIPVMVNARGDKLSKQTGAPSVNDKLATANLFRAGKVLGIPLDEQLQYETCETQLEYMCSSWKINRVTRKKSIEI